MKYCIECGSEYQDSVTRCADCADSELVEAEEMRRRGLPLPGERDTRRFARAGTAEDPLSAQRLEGILLAQNIPAFTRARRAGTVDLLTSAASHPWWEILVPEGSVEQASRLLAEERARMEAQADEAAQAAEEEAMEAKPS